jgi:hypothetical protein
MGGVADVDRLRGKASPNVLADKIATWDYETPYFYDDTGNGDKTLIHGGYVQVV